MAAPAAYAPAPSDSPWVDLGDGPEPSSWAPIDLSGVLDATYAAPAATLFSRTDGVCLLYPGLVHSFHGESESGKSLLLQIQAARLVEAGESVLFIDLESDPVSVVHRLQTFGASRQAILERFHYVQPDSNPALEPDHDAWAALLAGTYTLAVIDGVTDALSLFGYSTKDNDEITLWMRAFPRRLAKTGAAVVLVDHVTKSTEGRGRFAVGGQAKMNGLTGAAYTVEVDEPLGRGMRGVVVVRIGKDRPGTIRPHCGDFRKSDRTQEAARVVIDSTDPTQPVVVVEPPQEGSQSGPGSFRPTGLMEKVSRVIETFPAAPSQKQIRDNIASRPVHVTAAITCLVDEGYVRLQPGPRNAILHALVSPFRENGSQPLPLTGTGGPQ